MESGGESESTGQGMIVPLSQREAKTYTMESQPIAVSESHIAPQVGRGLLGSSSCPGPHNHSPDRYFRSHEGGIHLLEDA